MIYMIFDMHVHTSEGSLDGRVSIFDTVDKLKELGFDGMLVTDHDSYKGYEAWKNSGRTDFIVLKGVEYDTLDGGHMLVILPEGALENVDKLFKLRGLTVNSLIDIVHKLGGVVGPAHPYGYKRLGIANNPRWYNKMDIFNKFDFLEGFNSCCDKLGNSLAVATAKRFNKPITAGSDSHRWNCIGKAKTIIDYNISTVDDLIFAIKNELIVESTGEYFDAMMKKHSNTFQVGLLGFYAMNRIVSIFNMKQRSELASIILNN